MLGKRVLAACVLAAVVGLCVAVFAASPTQAASAPEPIQLVAGSVIALPQVLVTLTGQNWFFAKPLYASGPTISVWADADPPPTSGWTVNVTGRVLSSSGKLFVYATRLELLIDPRTQMPCPPPVAGSVWADVRDIPLNLDAPTEGLVPPDPSSLIPVREPVDAAPGSIAAAKTTLSDPALQAAGRYGMSSVPPQISGGTVALTGKIVAGVFFQQASPYVDYLYIEEPNRMNGIQVVPTSRTMEAWDVHEGDVVDVSGTVVSGAVSGECYLGSAVVTVVGACNLPAPLASCTRSLCGGAFGEQPALYVKPILVGSALSRVGTRVRFTGKCLSATTENGCAVLYLDDGSGLSRSGANGLKVVYYRAGDAPPNPVNQMITATGLLGAEMDGSNPVPLLRVPNARVIHIRPGGDDSNDGFTWGTAKYTIQEGIDAAYAEVPKCDVWVESATYCCCDSIYMKPGVSLYGGFIGDEAELSQRNWLLNPTAIRLTNGLPCIVAPTLAGGPAAVDGFTTETMPGCGAGGISCVSVGTDVTVRHNRLTNSGNCGVWVQGSTDHTIRILDNWVEATYDGVTCLGTSTSQVLIANNTIVGNSNGINLQSSSPTIANNIIASNDVGIEAYGGISDPALRYNCLFDNDIDYDWLPDPPNEIGTVLGDPCVAGAHMGSSSACIDAASDGFVAPGEWDVDHQPRITPTDETPDIGADEYHEHDGEVVTITPDVVVAPSGTGVVVVHVSDEVTDEDVEGRRVKFSISAGQITSISPGGGLETTTSGWGTTGSDGNVTLTFTTPATAQKVVATAVARLATGRAMRKATLYPKQYKVGFLYDLAHWAICDNVEDYLESVAAEYADVVYERIGSLSSGIDGSFNTVILTFPDIILDPPTPLTQAETDALLTFVQSGREKRVVLVGEFNPDYALGNTWLNDVAAGIGMNVQFSTGSTWYDPHLDYCRLCPVAPGHPVTAGVRHLWNAATSTFVAGWDEYAEALAYAFWAQTLPWILQQDTESAGSRIAIHDSSMFDIGYGSDCDTVPDKNFLFVHNLCTVFSGQ